MEFKIYDKPQKGVRFAKALIELRGRKCERCNNTEWLGQPIKLEVHHINGDKRDNTLENLQLLCPNCHSYTDNYGTKNIKRIDSITDEDILQAIGNSYTIREALFSLGLSDAGYNYSRVRELLAFNPQISCKQRPILNVKRNYAKGKRCPICNKVIGDTSTYCVDCNQKMSRIVERPNREQLKNLIRNETFVYIGKTYGVTDNAIRKWCKMEKLPYRKKDINTYSDEEWEKL